MTAREPFSSVSAMWLTHDVYATNNTPAINGEKYFSYTSPGGHTAFSSSPPSWACAHTTQPFCHECHFSLQTASDPDPFTINYYQWPIEHFDEAYMVSTTFSTSDPPLWSPLLTASARAKTLCSYSGQCLYCGGRDSSVRTCQNPFINSTVVLNPAWASSTMEATPSNNDNSVRSHTAVDSTSAMYNAIQRTAPNFPTRGDCASPVTPTTTAGTTPLQGVPLQRQLGQVCRLPVKQLRFQQPTVPGQLVTTTYPPLPPRTPSTALTIADSSTSTSSPPAHMRYGPTQTGGNNNSRRRGTFRTN